MNRCFTHYWTNATCAALPESPFLHHSACNGFRKRGLSAGDSLYIVTIQKGRLFLVGRMEVGEICDTEQTAQILGTDDLWDAEEHAIAAASTDRRFDREVPVETTKQLRFLASGEPVPLVFTAPGILDQQTLRSVRELHPSSAKLLDAILPKNQLIEILSAVSEPTSDEEALTRAVHQLIKSVPTEAPLGQEQPAIELWEVERFVRDPKVVAWVLQEAKGICEACNAPAPFTDANGEPFLEVHHVTPLSSGGSDRGSNTVAVYPNCHRRFHHSFDRQEATTHLFMQVVRLIPE